MAFVTAMALVAGVTGVVRCLLSKRDRGHPMKDKRIWGGSVASRFGHHRSNFSWYTGGRGRTGERRKRHRDREKKRLLFHLRIPFKQL